MLPCRVVVAFLLVVPALVQAQQPVCVTGRLEAVPGPTICMQGETHLLADTGIFLRPVNSLLTPYEGQVVQVTGVQVGLLCNVMDVLQVQPAPTQLVQCGTPAPGCAMRLTAIGPGIGFAMIAISNSVGFLPFSCNPTTGIEGTLLLASPAELLAAGPTGTGTLSHNFTVPSNNSLIGVSVVFQGAHATIGPAGPLTITNLESITIIGQLFCQPPNC